MSGVGEAREWYLMEMSFKPLEILELYSTRENLTKLHSTCILRSELVVSGPHGQQIDVSEISYS